MKLKYGAALKSHYHMSRNIGHGAVYSALRSLWVSTWALVEN
jgi:hypothetical protein